MYSGSSLSSQLSTSIVSYGKVRKPTIEPRVANYGTLQFPEGTQAPLHHL